MDFATSVLRGFYAVNALAVLTCCLTFLVRRALWRRRKRNGRSSRGFFPTYASAGNALQVLQVMPEPRAEYVLEEKLEEEADDDEDGDPCDPTKHLNRQLKQIRRGEKLERLTIMRPLP